MDGIDEDQRPRQEGCHLTEGTTARWHELALKSRGRHDPIVQHTLERTCHGMREVSHGARGVGGEEARDEPVREPCRDGRKPALVTRSFPGPAPYAVRLRDRDDRRQDATWPRSRRVRTADHLVDHRVTLALPRLWRGAPPGSSHRPADNLARQPSSSGCHEGTDDAQGQHGTEEGVDPGHPCPATFVTHKP